MQRWKMELDSTIDDDPEDDPADVDPVAFGSVLTTPGFDPAAADRAKEFLR